MNSEKHMNDFYEQELNQLLGDDVVPVREVAEANIDKAWIKVLFRKRKEELFFTIKKAFKYAAIILLAVALGYVIASYRMNKIDWNASTSFNIPNAEMGNVVLPDGSKVKLNSSSQLKYPLKFISSREVFLTGEAFFEVTSDPGKPFFVHVDGFTVKVTGTQFNVKSYPGTNPEVTLEKGKITVINKGGDQTVELKPNQNLIFDKAQNRFFVTTTDPHLKTDWTQGKIFMKNQTIEEMAKILERWYDVKIVFDNESIRKVRLTGTILKNKPIEQILNVLVKSESIDFRYFDDSNDRKIIHINYKR